MGIDSDLQANFYVIISKKIVWEIEAAHENELRLVVPSCHGG